MALFSYIEPKLAYLLLSRVEILHKKKLICLLTLSKYTRNLIYVQQISAEADKQRHQNSTDNQIVDLKIDI